MVQEVGQDSRQLILHQPELKKLGKTMDELEPQLIELHKRLCALPSPLGKMDSGITISRLKANSVNV